MFKKYKRVSSNEGDTLAIRHVDPRNDYTVCSTELSNTTGLSNSTGSDSLVPLPRGATYEGPMKDQQRHGQGKIFDSNSRLIYEGTFENDRFIQGCKYDIDGNKIYVGGFKNFQYHGKGEYETKSIKRTGVFENGELIDGIYELKGHKILYTGKCRNGLLEGEGKEQNGENYFIGRFSQGVLRELKEALYKGNYVKLTNEEDIYEIKYIDGTTYEGHIKHATEPVPEGYGRMKHVGIKWGSYHGETFYGTFKNGKKEGIGHSHYNNQIIIQDWRGDVVTDVKSVTVNTGK